MELLVGDAGSDNSRSKGSVMRLRGNGVSLAFEVLRKVLFHNLNLNFLSVLIILTSIQLY